MDHAEPGYRVFRTFLLQLTPIFPSFRLLGDLSGAVNIVVPLNLTGQVEILAQGLTFHLESSIEKGKNGSAKVTSLSCLATIRDVTVTNHNGGLFGLAVSVFKQGVSDNVRHMLQGIICKKVRKYIDEDANEKLAEAQTTSKLGDALESNALKMISVGGEEKARIDLSSIFDPALASKFFIDFRLKEHPICVDNTVELASWGEISYMGQGDTPFGPVDSSWPGKSPFKTNLVDSMTNKDSMVELVVSDFLPNSLLYHAYVQRLIKVLLTPKTKGVASFLRTTCEGSFCISDLAPQLAEQYPNSTVELALSATRAPAILFSEKNGGTISISMGALVVVFAVNGNQRRQVIVVDLDVVADAKLSIQGHNVSGSVELRKFELKRRTGTVDISDAEIDDIGLLVSQLAENLLNGLLVNGMPLPLPHVLRIKNSNINVLSRRMHIQVDVDVDERRLSRIAAQTFFKTPQFSDPDPANMNHLRRMVRPMPFLDSRQQISQFNFNNWSTDSARK
uniref:Lipid-binding serum glycoprotein C-terminal domain-containing protein n=1 Tax=Caenorhabditis japonica TaxID=281687 RepID=A0A8R1HX55_CAEJA